eukprot:scaffold18952_cov72-Phaeocystis_antarctica.AAC.8
MAIVSMAIVSTAELARRAVRIYVHSTHLYVDACTHVLCYATPLRAPLHAFCAARRDGKRAPRRAAPAVAASAAVASAAASADSEGCAAIRRLYREDWALYQAHCLSPQ